jgi:cytochrome d ubiquinol oxidase subunit I
MENLYDGTRKAPLVVFGLLRENASESPDRQDFAVKIEIPNFLSSMAFLDANAYVPGIKDLTQGSQEHSLLPVSEKMSKGKVAIQALKDYSAAKKDADSVKMKEALVLLHDNYRYFGYGYLAEPNDAIPSVKLTFYSFRIMVGLGFWFVILFILSLVFTFKNRLESNKWFLRAALISIPLAYLASQFGWVVTELGRQPWVIQDMMPTMTAVSDISVGSVKTTFVLFAIIFTVLLIAEIKIMVKQVKIGPNDGGNK